MPTLTTNELLAALARRFSEATGMDEETALTAVRDIDKHGLESKHVPALITTAEAMIPQFAEVVARAAPNGELVWGEDADPARCAAIGQVLPGAIPAMTQIVQRELDRD